MRDPIRPLPEIVRDIEGIRREREDGLALVTSGAATDADRDALATADAELCAFEDMCMRRTRHHLMSTGLGWGDQLRHPAAPGMVAQVRCSDLVECQGAEMTIVTATSLVAKAAGKGVAIADWSHGRIRLGDALGLEHPAREPVDDAPSQGSLL